MQWIDCKAQMPPINKQVLAYGPSKRALVGGVNIDICLWDGLSWWDDGGTELSQEGESTSTVWGDPGWTHWMALPAAPGNAQQQVQYDPTDSLTQC